jgi:FkbM family methyltransferase
MSLRSSITRRFYRYAPFVRGHFNYYGHTIYFPLGSHIFERACAEGVYEYETTNLILSLVESSTTYIDVGANIGLLSVPVLAERPGVKVLSIEASPKTLQFLQKTRDAATRREDWTIVGVAVGSARGEAEFWSTGGALGAFDGLRDTGRGGPKSPVRVPVRTLDEIWRDNGSPAVSVIKIDIEGGETEAIKGGRACVSATKPFLIIEWSALNLPANGIHPDVLLQLCCEMGYRAYAFPSLIPIDTKPILKIAMARTETFVLVPK